MHQPLRRRLTPTYRPAQTKVSAEQCLLGRLHRPAAYQAAGSACSSANLIVSTTLESNQLFHTYLEVMHTWPKHGQLCIVLPGGPCLKSCALYVARRHHQLDWMTPCYISRFRLQPKSIESLSQLSIAKADGAAASKPVYTLHPECGAYTLST